MHRREGERSLHTGEVVGRPPAFAHFAGYGSASHLQTINSREQTRTITPTRQLLSRLTATTRRVRRAGIRNEALREERQDLVACLDGRLAGRVDQVSCHNAVRAHNALREEGR